MLGRTAKTYIVSLGSLYLHHSTVRRSSIVTFRGCWQQIQAVPVGCQNLTQASDEVAIQREPSLRKECLKLSDYRV
jgi:hypothetical protein